MIFTRLVNAGQMLSEAFFRSKSTPPQNRFRGVHKRQHIAKEMDRMEQIVVLEVLCSLKSWIQATCGTHHTPRSEEKSSINHQQRFHELRGRLLYSIDPDMNLQNWIIPEGSPSKK